MNGEAPLPKVPRHVAIIMDGNGRWAQRQGLPRLVGHRAGVNNIRRILEAAADFQVPILSIYAFSTENWKRPSLEVRGLMRLFEEGFHRELPELHRNGVRICHLGHMEGVSSRLQELLREAMEVTRDNKRLTLNIAFNYGGRAEIVHAVQKLMADGYRPEDVTEDLLSCYMYTAGQPDVDLVIRTGGDQRLSNFLIWQANYAEYYVTSSCWPDFGRAELYEALLTYGQRDRRFGRVHYVTAADNYTDAESV
ncbi:MAG: polyprenyl diphosphate synthase [Anaerolineae bacterium]